VKYGHRVINTKLLVAGLGAGFAAGMIRLGQFLLDPLFEASAEVGEWFADHAGPKTRARIKSRFV